MDDNTAEQIGTAVTHWAQEKYRTNDIFIADISPDEEELERYLVILAARPLGYWLVAEAWLQDGGVEASTTWAKDCLWTIRRGPGRNSSQFAAQRQLELPRIDSKRI